MLSQSHRDQFTTLFVAPVAPVGVSNHRSANASQVAHVAAFNAHQPGLVRPKTTVIASLSSASMLATDARAFNSSTPALRLDQTAPMDDPLALLQAPPLEIGAPMGKTYPPRPLITVDQQRIFMQIKETLFPSVQRANSSARTESEQVSVQKAIQQFIQAATKPSGVVLQGAYDTVNPELDLSFEFMM